MSATTPLDRHSDERGHLVTVTAGTDVPFDIRRVFWIYGNASGAPRAGHASRLTTEFLVCVAGACRARLDGPMGVVDVVLDRPDASLLVPPLTWIDLLDFTPDCVLLVLADTPYRPDASITSRLDFEAVRAG